MKYLFLQFTLAMAFMFIFLKGYFPCTYNEAPVIYPPHELEGIPLEMETNMPFLYTNMDCLLKVKVAAPTVTLPRIKALTTGTVPQFIDIVMNLGAKAKVADNFLHQAHAKGKKMVFYGDDTWLMMFPHLFVRSDGTTSFFVNDYTEVDDNVTRHIDNELKNDWDMMFLHYLGLDHIGHVQGPFSHLIPQKLSEMDGVIKKIITAANTWDENTIILITGDHGMKDSGGHGGTTYAEMHVPLIVHHNKEITKAILNSNNKMLSQVVIQQSDIANTISALFGLAMPAMSAGKVIPQLLTCNQGQLLYTLHYNSIILQRNAENLNNCQNKLDIARKLFKNAVETSNFDGDDAFTAEVLFKECLEQISNDLIKSSVKQDAGLLMFGMFGTMNCFLVIYYQFQRAFQRFHTFAQLVLVMLMISSVSFTFYSKIIQPVTTILISFLTFMTLIHIWSMALKHQEIDPRLKALWPLVPFILHGALLPSSSYIEEEHYIFYYFTCTLSVLIAVANYAKTKRVTVSTAMPLTVIEIIRFARGVEDTRDWFVHDENLISLKAFHIVALIITWITITKLHCLHISRKCNLSRVCIPVVIICIHLHKFYFERSVEFAQMIWASIFINFVIMNLEGQEPVLISWLLVIAFQLRPYNTILLPAIIMCSYIFKKSLIANQYCVSIIRRNCLVIIHIWLGYTFFFIQGHRNSIANIDLAPGYLGLSTYVPALVGLLTLCHGYGFQTLSLLLLFKETKNNELKIDEVKHQSKANMWKIVISYKLFILMIIYIVTYVNRGHLFIWSVFAPKLLIECMHTFVLYVQMLIYCIYKFNCKLL